MLHTQAMLSMRKKVMYKDLRKFGFIYEFLSRFIILFTPLLESSDLIKMITEPNKSRQIPIDSPK